MGRVKDYILRTASDAGGRFSFAPLVTRDMRGRIFSFLLMMKAIGRILGNRLRGRVALVHVHMGDRGSAVRKGIIVLFSRMFGVPTLLHLHAVEMERHYAAASPVMRWLIRLPFRASTSIIVLGERFRAWLVNDLGIPSAKIDILYNGVDVGEALPARQFANGRSQTILFLGNLLERKGMSDFIAALGALPATADSWHAVIAGGGYQEPYIEQATRLGIADRISFTGWVDQAGVRALLAQADMLVLPSYEEGLPLVILEALAAGLPVICTPVGSISETLKDGDTALFCAPGDRAGLAVCMEKMLGDPALRAALSQRGRKLFDRAFSLGAFQAGLLAIYRKRCDVDYVLASSECLPGDTGSVNLN